MTCKRSIFGLRSPIASFLSAVGDEASKPHRRSTILLANASYVDRALTTFRICGAGNHFQAHLGVNLAQTYSEYSRSGLYRAFGIGSTKAFNHSFRPVHSSNT